MFFVLSCFRGKIRRAAAADRRRVYGSSSRAAIRSTMPSSSPGVSTSCSRCVHEPLRDQLAQPIFAARAAPRRLRGRRRARGTARSRPTQLGHARAARRDGLQDRRPPLVRLRTSCSDRFASIAETSRSAPSRSALFTTKMSAISMMPALSACTSSPVPGTSVTIEMSAVRMMSTSSWPTPTVSMIDDVLAGGVEHERGVAGRARQAAEVAARRHAADEHALVGRVRLHPQPIAEHGAAGERAGRIDGDHADGLAAAARRFSTDRGRSTSVLLPAPGGPVTPIR